MSRLFVGLLKSRRIQLCRMCVVQQSAAYIRDKPPKDKIGGVESVFVLAVMFVAVLGPSGWILSDLDNYKGRE